VRSSLKREATYEENEKLQAEVLLYARSRSLNAWGAKGFLRRIGHHFDVIGARLARSGQLEHPVRDHV
jgi:hypothetical protein